MSSITSTRCRLKLETPPFGQLTRDAQVYGKDAWYPENIAVLSSPMIFRDLRVVQLTLYPVQVNPVTHQARIYRNLDAQIVATDEPGENEIAESAPAARLVTCPCTGRWCPTSTRRRLAGATKTPGSYLIICTTTRDDAPLCDSLFVWKTRKGYPHRRRRPQPTGPRHRTIKAAIQEAYNTWNPPLEFVCLMGDPRQATIGLPRRWQPDYDHGYALLAGNDHIEDIGVGRLSGTDGTQMAIINAKIMAYERNPYMARYRLVSRGLLLRRRRPYHRVQLDAHAVGGPAVPHLDRRQDHDRRQL